MPLREIPCAIWSKARNVPPQECFPGGNFVGFCRTGGDVGTPVMVILQNLFRLHYVLTRPLPGQIVVIVTESSALLNEVALRGTTIF